MVETLTTGSSVKVQGQSVASPGAKTKMGSESKAIEILGACPTEIPSAKKTALL